MIERLKLAAMWLVIIALCCLLWYCDHVRFVIG